jgi:hypothetical protein
MPTWRERLRSAFTGSRPAATDADIFTELRAMALGIDPTLIPPSPDEPWTRAIVAAMELGLAEGTATVMTVADGSVSLYLSSGGGVIGAGEHAAVEDVARRFRRLAAESRDLLARTEDFPLPTPGEVRFHVRLEDARLTAAAPEAALRTGRHPLAPLYAAGQDVLTEIRLASP